MWIKIPNLTLINYVILGFSQSVPPFSHLLSGNDSICLTVLF